VPIEAKFGLMLTNIGQFGRLLANLDEYWPIWTNIGQFGPFFATKGQSKFDYKIFRRFKEWLLKDFTFEIIFDVMSF
jgi:hypothetical protein